MMGRGIFIRIRRRGERGAVAVIVAILLVAIFTLAALVIDIAALQADERAGQATGDFAATAGALALEPTTGGNPFGACVAAYQYFLANTPGLNNPPTPAAACAVFATVTFCDPATPVQAIIDVGPYRVTITNPVIDSSPLMQGRFDPAIDGSPCQRIAVQVQRTRAFLFGGIVNFAQGTTEPPAVARATAGQQVDGFASLVLLDPTGCNALYTSGQGNVWVRGRGENPGMITIDSSATYAGTGTRNCTSSPQNTFAVNASGNTQGKILAGGNLISDCSVADGLIMQYALMPGGNNAQAFDPGDVPPSYCHVVPRPIAGYRITRAPVDHRYNCKESYPSLGITGCKDWATTPPYIDNLRAAIGTSGVPTGFDPLPDTYIDQSNPGRCQTGTSATALVIPPPPGGGGWYVNCTHLDINRPVIFQPPLNLVFEGTVNVGGGALCVNVLSCADTSTSSDGYVYFRRGDRENPGNIAAGNLEKGAQAAINMTRVMVYLDNGRIQLTAGSGQLTWIAPVAGPFEDLALWSERDTDHLLGGQSSLLIEGTFFAPQALPFNYDGQADQFQPRAQFVTFDMNLSGQGTLVMEPDPERTTPIPLTGVLLIR
jgi:hypothetical protein